MAPSSHLSAKSSDVIAAGAVVVRKSPGGHEVLLVHRPRYDDWSFPKGKVDPGEHVTACAVREVLEETGLRVRLGVPLGDQRYRVSATRMKTVHYWMGRVRGDDDVTTYEANQEIDVVEWVPWAEAATRITYRRDREVLEQAQAHRRRTEALVVLRHAQAEPHGEWEGDDRLRPLRESGLAEAAALVPVLDAYGVRDLLSSSSTRCRATLEPYAAAAGLSLETHPALSEEKAHRARIEEIVARQTASRHCAVLCSHRPVLPLLFAVLGLESRLLEPAAMVVVHHRRGEVVAHERWDAPD